MSFSAAAALRYTSLSLADMPFFKLMRKMLTLPQPLVDLSHHAPPAARLLSKPVLTLNVALVDESEVFITTFNFTI